MGSKIAANGVKCIKCQQRFTANKSEVCTGCIKGIVPPKRKKKPRKYYHVRKFSDALVKKVQTQVAGYVKSGKGKLWSYTTVGLVHQLNTSQVCYICALDLSQPSRAGIYRASPQEVLSITPTELDKVDQTVYNGENEYIPTLNSGIED